MKIICLAAAGTMMLASVTGAGAQDDPEIELKLSYWVPPTHMLTPGYKEWGEALSKATDGKVTVSLYPSSQLGSGADHYDMVRRGIADMGLINPGYTPGRFPVIGATDLPFTVSDSIKAAPALTRWYKKYAEKEMDDVYVCHVFTHEPGTFHSNEPIRVPADVSGKNIRTANHTIAEYVTSMGGNSVQVPIMEAYETLKRGITDGITSTWGGLVNFNFGDVTKYTLDTPLYVSTFVHTINKDTYERMSESQQKALDSLCTPEWAAKIYQAWGEDEKRLEEKIQADGRESIEIGDEEIALWRKAAEPVVETWRQAVTKAGWDPDQVMQELRDELEKEDALF